jgi:hypothetical protein
VVHQGGTTTDTRIPLYEDPNWADGFDIVVHNECFSGVTDKEFVDRILKPHREGLPAILIHCAMHCYRVGDDRWFEFCGIQSPGHGPHYSYTINNEQPNHPIMAGFGERFVTPKGELYHSAREQDRPGTQHFAFLPLLFCLLGAFGLGYRPQAQGAGSHSLPDSHANHSSDCGRPHIVRFHQAAAPGRRRARESAPLAGR